VANWAFKPPNAQFVKITILAAQAFSIFATWRLAVYRHFAKLQLKVDVQEHRRHVS
jgi:hypothetical protein